VVTNAGQTSESDGTDTDRVDGTCKGDTSAPVTIPQKSEPPANPETGERGFLAKTIDSVESRGKMKEPNLLRRAARERWPITPQIREQAVNTCKTLLSDADSRVVVSAVKALVAMEAQTQTDEHHAEEIERLDSGKLTSNMGVKMYGVAAPINAVIGEEPEV
jgi:hypothetical protein